MNAQSDREMVQRTLEVALEENRRLKRKNECLRGVLKQVRGAVITHRHRKLIDDALRA